MVEYAKTLIPGENLGSVISAAAKERIEGYIDQAEKDGAKILVDGRGATVAGKEGGYYVGPTILDYVTTDMSVAREEIFGPVISIIRAKDVAEALEIENGSNYGNAAAVFTQSGKMAKEIMDKASAGMIGVNIGVPVPREPFSFGGWNDSKFGVGDITGRSSIEFWTQNKKTTVKWTAGAKTNWMS
jgi:malonate-semialdehyde dehydrogenase (acetylating)/methylmalonate-semialdehyde dehydrogenase